MKKSLLFAFVLLLCAYSYGQTDRWLSVRVGEGFLMAHRPTIPQLLTGHASSLELHYTVRSNMSKDWHHQYKGPYQGFAAYYIDLGNSQQLGRMYSVFPYIGFPLTQTEKSSLNMQLGCGLSVVDRKFDLEENFTNHVIGSHVNVGIQLSLKYARTIGRLFLGTGLSFSHASNGSFQLPNLGANVPSLDVYLGYRLNKTTQTLVLEKLKARERTASMDLSLAYGMRESNVVTREKHPVLELRGVYKKPFSAKFSYVLGADLIYNKATYAELDRDSINVIESLLPGLNGGVSMDFGSADLFLQAGWYPHTGYQELGSLYHRVGGRKVVRDKWVFSFSLKTHFARADYFAVGVGMKLK